MEQKEMEQEKEARRTRRDRDGGDDDKPKVCMDVGWDEEVASCGLDCISGYQEAFQLRMARVGAI
jgi:hypothetical protein